MYKSVCMFLVISVVSFITASEVTQPTVSKNQSLKSVSDSQVRLSKKGLDEKEVFAPVDHKIISTKKQVLDQASKKDQDVYIKSSKTSSDTYRQKLDEKKELENKRIMEFGTKEQKAELLSKEHPFQQNQQNHQSSLTRNHTATDLFFSEYSEGSSNNKYLEIYNPTSMTIDLSQYWIFQNSNGGPYTEFVDSLSGFLAPDSVYVITHTSADPDILAEGDLADYGICIFNGDDARALVKIIGSDTTSIDFIGDFPVDPGSGWDVAGVSRATQNKTLVRKGSVLSGNGGDWATSAGTTPENSEWIVYPQDTWDYLGSHTVEEHHFEGFEGPFPPFGWEVFSNNTSNTVSQYSTYSYSGSYSARFSSYYGSYSWTDQFNQYIISPKVTVSSSADEFSFMAYNYYSSFYNETFMVGVSTTDTNPASFTWSAEVTGSTAGWAEYVEDLSSYVGQDVYVAIKYTSIYQGFFLIDHIEMPPLWVDPNPVAVITPGRLDFGEVNTSQTKTVDITIKNNGGSALAGSMTSNNSKFGLGAFSGTVLPGAEEVVTVTYTPTAVVKDTAMIMITHNGTPSVDTVYAYGEGTEAIFISSFEGQQGVPAGWTVVLDPTDPNTSRVGVTGTTARTGQQSFRFSSYSLRTVPQYLISNKITLPADGMEFEMWHKKYTSSYPETFQIGVSTTDSAVTSFTWGDEVSSPSSLVWTKSVQTLASYAGQDVYLAIKSTTYNSSGYYMYVDDIRIQPLPPTPLLSISTNSVDFPATNTAADSSNKKSFRIINSGLLELSGTITYPVGYSGPASFASNDTLIEVVFSPTVSGIIDGYVKVVSNGGDDSLFVSGSAGVSTATWNESWPTGWTRLDNDGSGDGWDYFDEDGARTGSGHVAADPSSFSDKDDWLISPKYDVVPGDAFSFYAKSGTATSTYYPDIMEVLVSPSGSADPEDFTVRLDSVRNFSTEYVPFSYNLDSYDTTSTTTADSIRIAIVYRGVYYGLSVDDVAGPKTIDWAGGNFATNVQAINFGTWPAGFGVSDSAFFRYENFAATGNLVVDSVRFVSSDNVQQNTTLDIMTEFSVTASTVFPQVTSPDSSNGFYIHFTPPADSDSMFSGEIELFTNSEQVLYAYPVMGKSIDALYYEAFRADSVPAGWTNNSDRWKIAGSTIRTHESDNNYGNYLYHADDNSPTDSYKDTVYTDAIILPVTTDGSVWKLGFDQYNSYMTSYYEKHDVSVSNDGGANWNSIWESGPVSISSFTPVTPIDLGAYAGDTIHVAFVYHGDFATRWRVDNIRITKFFDPILSAMIPDFPATAIGDTSVRMMQVANVGSGKINATVSVTGSDLKFFGPGLGVTGVQSLTIDTLSSANPYTVAVHYIPTVQGVIDDSISIVSPQSVSGEGTVMDAGSIMKTPDANAGIQVATFEESWIGWYNYSLEGNSDGGYGPDRWAYYGGGGGHNSDYYTMVQGYEPLFGGVNDFLVSPRLSVRTGDVLSFFTKGGYSSLSETIFDSMTVWVSTEKPMMGYEMLGVARIDTGFVNTSAFTVLGSGNVPFDWEAVDFDVSTYGADVWLLIQSNGEGYQHFVDDVAYPKTYVNPLPVLAVSKSYDFGVTQPVGDSASFAIKNTGMSDLMLDSAAFDSMSHFEITDGWGFSLPVTLEPGKSDTFEVAFMPTELDSEVVDTLRFFSNYMVGQTDAYGSGTNMMVFKANADNAPPGAVMLLTPDPTATPLVTIDANNATGSTDFYWTNTTDPDGTPIEYVFEMWVTGGNDTLDTLLSSNEFSLDHSEVVEMMEELSVTSFEATWNVYADDGFDATGSSNGPWTLSFDAGWVLGGLDNNTIPDVFALHNNYPNPFNPVTNIKYDIPVASDVRIDIFNIAGEKVRTLVSREHQPGRYKIQWNATNEFGSPVATGMYIYKIHAKDFVSVKKLLLMK